VFDSDVLDNMRREATRRFSLIPFTTSIRIWYANLKKAKSHRRRLCHSANLEETREEMENATTIEPLKCLNTNTHRGNDSPSNKAP
jgi:hypothetical protein